jgi:hypothetical protein
VKGTIAPSLVTFVTFCEVPFLVGSDLGTFLREIFFIRVYSRAFAVPFAPLREIFFAIFVPLADVAKGGDGAKSAFCGYSSLCLRGFV